MEPKRGQTAYWAEYAIRETTDAEKLAAPGVDTVAQAVRGVRGAKTGDAKYTVIEGGYDSLELGLEVEKHATLTHDLTFRNTEVFADDSTFSIDSTVDGGISVATNAAGNKYYTGLLSSTDVGRLLSRTIPTAIWVGRFSIIVGTATPLVLSEDFKLAINFAERTLKSHNPDDTASLTDADLIIFESNETSSASLMIDGKFNDRGIIYGTTIYQLKDNGIIAGGSGGILTGLIGQKGAAAVFYSSSSFATYAGGFVAVPDRGILTNAYDNIPASYNVWATDIDTTTQKDTNSGVTTASADNTAAFTTEVPAVASQTTPFSLNLAPLGGGVGNGFIGYGAVNARHIGLLSSASLGGVNLNTGTATWTGVMRLIIGNGGTDGVLTQSFTLNVAFDDESIGLAGAFAFTRDTVAYDLTFAQLGWDEDSGLITGTVNIIPTANTGQISVGDVRGLIGADGLVAAFRSTTASHSSFTGGFVASEIKRTETPFADYFSSAAGGSLLQDSAAGTTAKFAKTVGNDFANSIQGDVYLLGAGTVNSGSNPNGFVFSTGNNWAVGLLNTTNLGAPLPLIYAGAAVEWTGKLYISNASGLRL